MGRWRRCPRCGFTKAGYCPMCFPAEAAAEKRAEVEAFRLSMLEEAWRNLEARRCPP